MFTYLSHRLTQAIHSIAAILLIATLPVSYKQISAAVIGSPSAHYASYSASGGAAITPQVALLRLMTAPTLRSSWFAPSLLAQVSPAQLQQGRDATTASMGRFRGSRRLPSGEYLLIFPRGVIPTQVVLDTQGRIAGLLFEPPQFPGVSRMIDVGGYRLHLNCAGSGTPTVVMDAGLGEDGATWAAVQPQVAVTTRTCVYDRAGYGMSDRGPLPRTSAQIVKELRLLLAHAGMTGPFILVGHSFGGMNVRLFSFTDPHDVAGLVLVDSEHEDQDIRAPAQYRQRNAALLRQELKALAITSNPVYGEEVAMTVSEAQVRAARHSLGTLPLIVLTRGRATAQLDLSTQETTQNEKLWAVLQNELARLSTNSQHIVASSSDHFIQIEQPTLVTNAIQRMIATVRTHHPLGT